MTLLIHLLGSPQISRDGDPIDIPGHRPLALLAYLLVAGKAHSRQHLVDLLFEGPDDPRAALRWTLSKLRKAIGPEYLLADRQEIAFNFESDYWLDLTAFEAGRLDLYRGDFLEGLYVRDAYRCEVWLLFERERLRGHYQAGLTQQLEQQQAQGDDQAVIETAHQLLRQDNLREDGYRALMRAYARLGKREAAMAHYTQCRQVLEAELGVDPVTETAELASAIERGQLLPEVLQVRMVERRSLPARKPAIQQRFLIPLVGRSAEMDTLRQAWYQAAEGTGRILLVEGEPGIGKTRLIEELLSEVSDQALVLRAKCPELQEPLAYTLFMNPLRQVLSGDPPPGLTDTWLAEISRLLPELRDRYPDLLQPAQLEPAEERRRLFDAISTTLLALVDCRPLALFLDDLQWADLTSLELLQHLIGRISQASVLIIGAYRPHEIGPGHPLQTKQRAWQRTGLLTSLWLPPLSEAAVNNLLQALTSWTGDDPSFGALIYRETAGNPLFVVEVVASLRDEGRLPQRAEEWSYGFQAESLAISPRVQAIIEARLNRLDDLSHQLITTAAVMRSNFRAELVQAVSGRSELETLESLERLLASGLLVEAGEERFTFSHDKIREVAYGGLSQLRRKLLHRRMAETLESLHRGREKVVAERLAYHYEQAGDRDRALHYYLQAGQAARERYAYAAAITYYQKALTYLKEQQNYERAARTLMQLGLTYHNTFDFQRARQAYQEGFALWQRAADRWPAVPPAPAPCPFRLVWEDLSTLDLTLTNDVISGSFIEQLFSGLAELSPELEVLPDVARSWEVQEGGRKYVFHLRDDVRWSDGVPVTAGDFEYAWRRVLDPDIGSPAASFLYDIQGARAFHQGQLSDPGQIGVQALDDSTLLVELEGPTGYFPHWLTVTCTFPVPRHVVEAHGEAWAEPGNIVTNGPFRLEAWQRNESLVLARNPEYHGRFGGNLRQVTFAFLDDTLAALGMYQAGELDILDFNVDLALPDRDQVRHKYAGEYTSFPWTGTDYVVFHAGCPPFDDLRVRQAFALAIDRERLADVILRGYFSPALGGFVPLGLPGHSAGIGLPYDPGRARQLLAQAGYPGGRGFPSISAYTSQLRVSDRFAISDYLLVQWRETLGIEITWQDVYWTPDLALKGPSLFITHWTADLPDPDNFLRVAVQSNVSAWRNDTYYRLVEKARHVSDQAERMSLYRQAEGILIGEAAILPLTYLQMHLLVKPWVKRFPVSPRKWWFWKDVIIEPH
jgi:ABC-type oligopeptide transport system substrate-binding subunit/DNA-binding SARP family transcriptional activator/tetratricopeptide (TPR) repeat protein